VLKDDESIWQCRLLLQHPLAIEDDMRLVSTVELMAIRERVTNNLSPYDKPVGDATFNILHEADLEFQNWFNTWDQAFSQKYEDAGEEPSPLVPVMSDKLTTWLSLLSTEPSDPAFPCGIIPQCYGFEGYQWSGRCPKDARSTKESRTEVDTHCQEGT
jgi:hypothetical protein